VTTVVRPTEADLIAIARRINGPLSPEGAESWYRNDGAVLLQEIATLRQEAEAARHSFYEDGAQAEPNATLYEWAKAWKANATGYWEKTQTKNLRTRIVELTRANEDLQAQIEKIRDEHERNVEMLNARCAERMAQAKKILAQATGLL
jgi:hypothetical protein